MKKFLLTLLKVLYTIILVPLVIAGAILCAPFIALALLIDMLEASLSDIWRRL